MSDSVVGPEAGDECNADRIYVLQSGRVTEAEPMKSSWA
jgi:hypothetical protein